MKISLFFYTVLSSIINCSCSDTSFLLFKRNLNIDDDDDVHCINGLISNNIIHHQRLLNINILPTGIPTLEPTGEPSLRPSLRPSIIPTNIPTIEPTGEPSLRPSLRHSIIPTNIPTNITFLPSYQTYNTTNITNDNTNNLTILVISILLPICGCFFIVMSIIIIVNKKQNTDNSIETDEEKQT